MAIPYSSPKLSGVDSLQHPWPRYMLIHLRQTNRSISSGAMFFRKHPRDLCSFLKPPVLTRETPHEVLFPKHCLRHIYFAIYCRFFQPCMRKKKTLSLQRLRSNRKDAFIPMAKARGFQHYLLGVRRGGKSFCVLLCS